MNSFPSSPATGRTGSGRIGFALTDRSTLELTLFLTALGCALLQLWRPLYFLTDDNLSAVLPALTEFSRRLWSGQSPFVSNGIFGGAYDQLGDPSVTSLLSPFALVFSWVANTPWYYALVDIVSICNAFCIAGAFSWSALWFRRRFSLDVPRWLVVCLALSYTFTPYNLFVGSAWLGFLNPQASLPLVLVGCLMPSATRGIALQVAALCFSLFGGHAHPFIMLCLFTGVVGLALSVHERSIVPAQRVMIAGVITGLLAFPVVWQAFDNFLQSARGAGLAVTEMSRLRLEWPLLLATMTAGPIGSWYATLALPGTTEVSHGLIASGYSPANYAFFMSIATMVRLRGMRSITWVAIATIAVAVLMITRPDWLAGVFVHIPVIRSLRWPFRELWVMSFGIHLFLLFEGRWLGRRELPSLLVAGALVMGFLLRLPPPTLGSFRADRRLVINGVAEQFWKDIQRKEGDVKGLVVGMDTILLRAPNGNIPFTLLGTHNFGMMLGFTSSLGYTFIPSIRRVSSQDPERPIHPGGIFLPDDARAIAERHPEIWMAELEALNPPVWSIVTPRSRLRFSLDENTLTVIPLPNTEH